MTVTAAEIAAALALVTALVGLYLARSNRQLLRSDAAEKIQAAAAEAVGQLSDRVDELEIANKVMYERWQDEKTARQELQEENRKLRERMESQRLAHEGILDLLTKKTEEQDEKIEKLKLENEELRHGVEVLVEQLREANIEPRWEPK